MSRAYTFLDHPGPIAFAHRGGARDRPENSMPAFQHAVDLGYRYLETDVHATADGVLVAFHDRTLDRVTDRHGPISRLPYAEVAAARIHGIEPIPRLEDILGTWPDVRVNIDIKDAPAIGPLAAALHRTRAWGRVCITSFSTRRLAQMRARLPLFTGEDVCTALGPRGVMALRARSAGGPAGGPAGKLVRLAATGVACAQVPYGLGRVPFVTRPFLDHAHRLGLKVHAWTVNDPTEMGRLLDLGIDGIMTDDLEALRDVMAARGLWPDTTRRDETHPNGERVPSQRPGQRSSLR
ncbi:glycerophosphodiester phosphodiesterase [Actinomadura craniellae]|uniref:Glycerophosphodiester phosphodiesterase n=1 Tax=Actinomadura craniellae TaxID=2231787 RepID=A0A365H4I9_9ACTN|nr:glycerophosphodiester phosphodiesterase [Actinomadura craniellae]RAY14017.1 glycerophosphodiester phosphodiesterase [Actinomadura craniellae]